MGLTKAKLEIEREVGKSVIEVLFNPSEYQLTDGSSYSEKKIPGLDGPIIQYISGDATELSLSLFAEINVTDFLWTAQRINRRFHYYETDCRRHVHRRKHAPAAKGDVQVGFAEL